MKTNCRRHVEASVGVMHAVHAPENRHDVQQPMLPVDRNVQQQDPDEQAGPGWQHVQQAVGLRDDAIDGKLTMVAPSLWVYEVVNGITVAVRRDRLTTGTGRTAVDHLWAVGVSVVDPEPQHVYTFATRSGMSAYDASYVALAEALSAPLWTGDRALYDAAHGEETAVRCIGDYPE